MKNIILIFVGSFSLSLGLFGMLIPILPTTPFLLLTAYCYCRGSKRLYNKFITNRYLGKIIKPYLNGAEIPKRAKFIAITMIWCSILASIVKVEPLYLKSILFLIGIAVSCYLIFHQPKLSQ